MFIIFFIARILVETLRYNSWFDSLIITQPVEAHKIQPFVTVTAGEILQDNRNIKKLVISGVGVSASFQAIAKPLSMNKQLTDIDFSQSELEDKGAIALSNDFLSVLDHGLRCIDFTNCGISRAGFSNYLLFISNLQNSFLKVFLLFLNHC